MKRLLPLLALGSVLAAQDNAIVVRHRAPVGYSVDQYMDFEAGTNGNAMTAILLGSGTHGTACTWGIAGDGAHMYVSTTGEKNLLSAVKVGSTVYPDSTGTRSFKFDPEGTLDSTYAVCSLASPPANASFGLWYYTTSTDTNFLSMTAGLEAVNGDYVVTHWYNAGVELQSGDVNIPIAPSTYYWITGVYHAGGTNYLDVFDANGVFVGESSHAANGSSTIGQFVLGRGGTDAANGTGQWYWDDAILSTSAVFPLIPWAPTPKAPAYDNDAGYYNLPVSVTLSESAPASVTPSMLYCTDSTGTCSPSSSYSTAVSISSTGTHLRSVANIAGWATSAVKDATYTQTGISQVGSPVVQTTATSTHALTKTLTANTMAAVCINVAGVTISSVSGSVNGAYSQAVTQADSYGAGGTAACYYKANVTGGSETVTVTFSGTPSYAESVLTDWNGIATSTPPDKTAGFGSGYAPGTNPTLALAAPTQAGELILGMTGCFDAVTPGAGTNYSSLSSGAHYSNVYRILPTATAQSVNWTGSSSYYWGVAASFKHP